MAHRRAKGWSDALDAGRAMGPWGWCALATIVLGAVTCAAGIPGLARALVLPSVSAATPAASDPARIEAFRASFKDHVAQVNGRSMFFVPAAPPPPPPPEEAEREPEAPPAPSRYGGPAVIAMIGGAVWLDNGERLHPDEEAKGGLRLVSINPPWGARIEWSGQEWDVPLFDRTTAQFLEKPEAQKPAVESQADETEETP